MRSSLPHHIALAGCLLLLSCDSVQPDSSDELVIEGFFDTGQSPPSISVRKTVGLSSSQESVTTSFVTDAEMVVWINGVEVPYSSSTATPGQYEPQPLEPVRLDNGDQFRLEATWRGEVATVSGRMPPRIRLDSVLLSVPEFPVEAVLVDSLRLDSLGINAQTGFLYAVEAAVWWTPPQDMDDFWVHAQLKPFTDFSSLVVDFFLLPEQVFPEGDAVLTETGQRKWTGIYAIPVTSVDAPLPPHNLRIAAVRSTSDYADYAATRSSPERREPTGNLTGAIGIVAGVSVDSLVVELDAEHAGKRTRVIGSAN